MASADTLIDTLFDGRYRIVRKLGSGGMANVYLAEDQELGRQVAIKVLDDRHAADEQFVERFRREPTSVRTAISYARQALSALRVAHRRGLVHRDIKPHNVLVDGEGRLKVTDFGIARAGASQMTEAGSIIGTAQYLSPEQARGTAVDARSDIYSVGVVLYEMLTGTVPYTGD